MSLFSNLPSLYEHLLQRPGGQLPDGAGWPVAEVVRRICLRAGMTDDMIDAGLIPGRLAGMPVTARDDAFAAIEELALAYLFDASSFDGRLHFVPRGGDPVATITLDDLVDDGEDIRDLTRRDSISIPRVLHLEYYDTEGGLNPDKQSSDRSLDNRSTGENKVTTRVIMTATDAAQSVVIRHKILAEEQRGEWSFSLPDSWSWLTVGDIVILDGDRIRLTEVEIDEGRQNYKAVFDRASNYQTSVLGLAPSVTSEPIDIVIGATTAVVVDGPVLRDADDRLGYYIAVSGTNVNWSGALVELSTDGGVTYDQQIEFERGTVMAELLTTLPAHSPYYPDDVHTVQIKMLQGDMDITPVTLADMMNRANLALIGGEYVNIGDAQDLGGGVWELSYFLRGRKGTPVSAHAPGTRLTMLTRVTLALVDADRFLLGRDLTVRATTYGSDEQIVQTVPYTGQSQTERAPAYLRAVRGGGDIVITWQGVGRLGGGVNVAQGSRFAGYRVTVGASVIDTQATALTVADPGGAVTIQVQQLNEITGAGPAAQVVI